MKGTKSTPAQSSEETLDLSGDSDYDLLEMMTWRESDEKVAREAFAELWRRHVRYLYSVCRKYSKGLGGDDAAEDLTSETFKLVYEKGARTFKPGSTSDLDGMRRHVRAWLGRIAHNLACDVFRGRVPEIRLEEDQRDSAGGQESPEDSERSSRLLALMEEILTKRELDVLRVTSQYVDLRKPHQKLPDDVLEDLSQQWGVTHENIRQIKSRALKKLEQALTVEMKVLKPEGEEPDRITS